MPFSCPLSLSWFQYGVNPLLVPLEQEKKGYLWSCTSYPTVLQNYFFSANF